MPQKEVIKISVLGMKFECENPTNRGILLVLMVLILFVVAAALLYHKIDMQILKASIKTFIFSAVKALEVL